MLICDNKLRLINPQFPGLLVFSNLSGDILECNHAFSKLLNKLDQTNIEGCNEKTLFHKKSIEQINKHNQIVLTKKTTHIFEESWLLINNQLITCQVEKTPVFDPQNKPIGVLTSASNISHYTEQLKVKNSTIHKTVRDNKATELYLKNIISNLADHVFWEDRNGVFLGCNDQQAINVGLKKAEDLIGKTVFDIGKLLNWQPEMANQLRKNDLEVINKNKTISVEEEVTWADGIPRTYLSKKTPLTDDDGECVGLLGLAFDITERKHMENSLRIAKDRSESSNLAKSNFIANISHDLRTPLHTLLGIAELLQIKQHYPEQEEHIEGIIQSGQSLLQLVEQILQFSEIETNTSNLQIETIDLRQLIENLILEHVAKANNKNIDIIISYCESTPRLIKSNTQYLRRIINNLLGNSLKFTKKGHVLIAVEPVDIKKDRATLQLVVEDTGVGIDNKDIKHIFDRFYRAAPSYHGIYKGSGLGLAIAKQLTEHLGGKLRVNSQLGIGTTFSCTLTFATASKVIDYKDLENKFKTANVLIIDDHPKRRETLLKHIPSNNKLALTSTKAVDQLMNHKTFPDYNLIIIDDQIKSMRPDSLAKVIHSLSDEHKRPLLVLVTKLKENHVVNTPNNCFQLLLTKPIQPTEISHRLAPTWKKWTESQQRKYHQPISKPLTVLVVEDEPMIQRFTKAILSEFGCKVEIAKNGAEALEKSNTRYDLIFMDIGLPDMTGIEVTEKIRLTNTKNSSTPIIALTAHVSKDDKNRCTKAGVNDFLTKPASYSTFKQLLQKYQSNDSITV